MQPDCPTDNPSGEPASPSAGSRVTPAIATAPLSTSPSDPAGWLKALWSHPCPHCGAEERCRFTRENGRENWACRHLLDHLGGPRVECDGGEYTLFPDPAQHRKDVFAEVLKTIELLRPTGLFEIRVLGLRDKGGKSHNASGYFDDKRKAAKAIVNYEARRPDGIYLLLNEPNPSLIARSPNRMTDYPKTSTSDSDITRRQWLFLDLDPKRPAGVGSTTQQLDAAVRLARECRSLLCDDAGWPSPVEGLSGNGAYLLFPIDMPNDAETTALITNVLKAIHHKVGLTRVPADEPVAQVDLTTFNAARIARLLGTVNRKGQPTTLLPHRRSRVTIVPERLERVTAEQLRAVVADWPTVPVHSSGGAAPSTASPSATRTTKETAVRPPASTFGHRLLVADWLRDRSVGFSVKAAPDHLGRTVYLLDNCPFDSSHGASKEVAIYQATDGKLGAGCKHDSCSGRGWKEFKDAIGKPDAGHYDPPLPPRSATPTVATSGPVHEHLTDLGNAQRLVRLFGSDIRHCHPWDEDLVWDGRHWATDDTAQVERWAKDAVRSIYTEAHRVPELDARQRLARHASNSESARAIAAMVRLARSEPTIPVLPGQMDRDNWALNVQNGTLELRSGTLRPHRREDLLTKLASVAYDPAATCPTWEAFLEVVMGGNRRLVDYLQRVVGCALTGDVSEQVMWVLFGDGQNGKSTYLNTVLGILGVYAMQAVPELVMARDGDAHPTERADLFGRRLVACVETEEGRRLAESLVKQLTGGERVRARRMREDFWEFDPTHKLFLVTNHKPTVRGADKGIWRRLKLIPFTVTIPEAKKDKNLPEKLQSEWPGILAWAVRGCLEWQRSGLNHPPEVEAATADYRAEMDTVGAFLKECCTTGPDEFRVRQTSLYNAYANWAAKGDGSALGRNDFNRRLEELGFTARRSADNGATQWHGLSLLAGLPVANSDKAPSKMMKVESPLFSKNAQDGTGEVVSRGDS